MEPLWNHFKQKYLKSIDHFRVLVYPESVNGFKETIHTLSTKNKAKQA